jgi:ABC-type uncharacterized transport system involved in gliding motility auxiliary subunit
MDDVNNLVVSDKKEGGGKKYLWLLILLLILILILVVAVYLIQKQTFYKSKAYSYTESTISVPSSGVEIANSYAFASPLKAKTGGEYIRVTIYVLDAQGLGIKGKSVELGEAAGLTVNDAQATSDDSGMVYFDVSSSKAGLYVIQPIIEGKILSQKINITFE